MGGVHGLDVGFLVVVDRYNILHLCDRAAVAMEQLDNQLASVGGRERML